MCKTMVQVKRHGHAALQQLLLTRKHMLHWSTKLGSEKSNIIYDLFELIFKLEPSIILTKTASCHIGNKKKLGKWRSLYCSRKNSQRLLNIMFFPGYFEAKAQLLSYLLILLFCFSTPKLILHFYSRSDLAENHIIELKEIYQEFFSRICRRTAYHCIKRRRVRPK